MTLRIAVVGAGPSGLYAADALASAGVEVDVLDRLPVPFGLVRYGVAPDHFSIRSVRETLAHVLERPEVRFLGAVEVGDPDAGADVSVAELLAAYDGVVLTYGAARDRHLEVPGEELTGSIAATDLVAWYCGHPDADREAIESVLAAARSVVVVGVGNVAVDVTRVLTAPWDRLAATDMPQHVLEVLRDSTINDVHVLGRRGPAQATWTTKELKELGELEGVDVTVDDPHDFDLEPVSAALVESDRVVARNVDVLRSWSERALDGSHKHIHLHFHSRPAEVRGNGRVESVVVERTTVDDSGAAHGTGETYEVGAQLVVRSVGYRGIALPGVPFDARRNVIPNVEGRVVDDTGTPVAGLYVAGWIKRGPTGIIGTNKKDAGATVASLLADLEGADATGGDGIVTLLAQRGVVPVDLDGWSRIDAAEKALGTTRGRARTTIHERDALVTAARP
ncbi:MAG TPA: FAD-dependent oxidoreductase [Candidatus Nanopelagicales bacterium]|nr:FAD-dependent oxidoreductase [Candidatus Nanopelagicales bacterium]